MDMPSVTRRSLVQNLSFTKEKDMTLEELIEKAIAENTDPFTTDADIRFFETEEWNAKKLLDNLEGIE